MTAARRLAIGLAAVLALGAAPAVHALAFTPPSPGCLEAPVPRAGVLDETSRHASVDGRLLDITVRSGAMHGDQHVNVLLPTGYGANSTTRYPVLYLLHGAFGSYADWVTNDVVAMVGDRPLIVVMPDDGPDGSYSDWYGTVAGTLGPAPAWETYHISELIPFVERQFRTASTRYIAGLSSGGSGAMKYAAAHPGLFAAVGSFSGAVDTDVDYPFYPTISEALWGLTLIPGMDPAGHCTWGDPYTFHVNWLDNDPTYLAENLQGTELFLACGDGQPGPYDAPGGATDPVEYEVWAMNQQFVAALDARHIAHTDDFYGHGTHTWPYWKRDFQRFLSWLPAAPPPTTPSEFTYRSARPAFSAWGWDFAAHRDVREFAYLRNVGAGGFDATGSGRLDVTTAALYQPGQALVVRAGNSSPQSVVADVVGRLHLQIDLGPSHQFQQYKFDPGTSNRWRHVRVTISDQR